MVELRELREHIRNILDLPEAEQPDVRELLLQVGRDLKHTRTYSVVSSNYISYSYTVHIINRNIGEKDVHEQYDVP